MNKETYNEDLWDEIPSHCFMALGRRGKESIDLNQCFIPHCEAIDNSTVHPIKQDIEKIQLDAANVNQVKRIFQIYCESCQKAFNLIFQRSSILNSDTESDESSTKDIILERVYAEDSETGDMFGDIGYVQYDSRKRR